MKDEKSILEFIVSCIKRHHINWTYHVNMRLKERFIPREAILLSTDSFEIIEEYPNDKYFPSYLIYGFYKTQPFHIQIATDIEGDCVTVITAYKPDLNRWEDNFKKRRKS